jgi:hypothetical protein
MGCGVHTTPYTVGIGGGEHSWGMKLTTHLYLLLQLQMSGATPLLPLYAFICALGQLCLCMFRVINMHFALCSVWPSALRAMLTAKTQAWTNMPHISPGGQLMLCNWWRQYHLQRDGAVTVSAEWVKYNGMGQSVYLLSGSNTTGWGSRCICWVGQIQRDGAVTVSAEWVKYNGMGQSLYLLSGSNTVRIATSRTQTAPSAKQVFTLIYALLQHVLAVTYSLLQPFCTQLQRQQTSMHQRPLWYTRII